MTPATYPDESRTRSGRAAPLAAPERRAAIIDATIPLLRDHGRAITTRQIAEAAGVAEGTIFSVFADKESLIAEAVDAALDPRATIEQLQAIDTDRPLEHRLIDVVRAFQERFSDVWQLMTAVGPDRGQAERSNQRPAAAAEALRDALELHLGPASSELRREPSDAAGALLALMLGCSHPVVVAEPLAPAEIVDLFLHGVSLHHPESETS